MNPLNESGGRERLWLTDTTAAALEVVSRCPDVDDVLRFWAREIAKQLARVRVALFVIEGERWLRILPENQAGEVPLLTEAMLSSALISKEETVRVASLAPGHPETILVRYAARDSWRGILALWMERDALSAAQIRQACDVAAAIGRCLTVLKKSEMSREQAIAQERSRWAAELHDGHLQMLSSAKLQTEVCVSLEREHARDCLTLQPLPAQLRTELERLHDLMTDTVREARQFLLELRSPPVTADQFLPWLRAYADDFSRENGIRVEMQIDGEGELPQSHVEEATRLVREALTNVRKHARAGEVRIVVVFSDRHALISVSDDGVGFDVRDTMERLLDSSHNGLIGIRYRAESVGGEMRLRSEVGKGTTLVFRLPRTAKRSTSDSAKRRGEVRAFSLPKDPVPSAGSLQDTSVRDSIRATLAEAIDSFLEQQADARASHSEGGE